MPATGMRDPRALLETDHGLDLSGWQLTEARAVSDDGLTIVGIGRNPASAYDGAVAVLPEPAGLAYLGLALAYLLKLRDDTTL